MKQTVQEIYSQIAKDRKVLNEITFNNSESIGILQKLKLAIDPRVISVRIQLKKMLKDLKEQIAKETNPELKEILKKAESVSEEASKKLSSAVWQGRAMVAGIVLVTASLAVAYYHFYKKWKASKAKTEEEKKRAESEANKDIQNGLNDAKRIISSLPKEKQIKYMKRINLVQSHIK